MTYLLFLFLCYCLVSLGNFDSMGFQVATSCATDIALMRKKVHCNLKMFLENPSEYCSGPFLSCLIELLCGEENSYNFAEQGKLSY